MRRRSFLEISTCFLCVLCLSFVTSFSSGCAASDEAAAIIDSTLPMVQGIATVVGLADPAMAPAIGAAVLLYTGAVHEFDTVYASWKNAAPDQQPSLLAKVEAAAQTVGQNLTGILNASRVVNPQKQNTIGILFAAASAAVEEVIGFVGDVKAAGGTTTAAAYVAEDLFAGREPRQAVSGSAKSKPAKRVKAKVPISAAHIKKDLAKKLTQLKTGDTQLDATRADIASKLK